MKAFCNEQTMKWAKRSLCIILALLMSVFMAACMREHESSDMGISANLPVTEKDTTTVSYEDFFVDGFSRWPLGIKIALSVPEREEGTKYSFRVSIDGGGAYTRQERDAQDLQDGYKMRGDEFTISERTAIYWTQNADWSDELRGNMKGKKQAYLKIISYAGEHIIGYTVLRFDRMTCEELAEARSEKLSHEDMWKILDNGGEVEKGKYYCLYEDHLTSAYHVKMLESVRFPKIDGEYQDISQDYVTERMTQLIDASV